MIGQYILVKQSDSYYSEAFDSLEEATKAYGNDFDFPGEVVCLYDMKNDKYIDIPELPPYKVNSYVESIIEDKKQAYKKQF